MKKLVSRTTAETSESKPNLQAKKSDSMHLKNYFANAKYICGFTRN